MGPTVQYVGRVGFYSTVQVPVLVLVLLCLIAATSQEISSSGGFDGCTRLCGNVSIEEPFGIEPGCYASSWFRITCNDTGGGVYKPFISRINLEYLRLQSIDPDGVGNVVVKSPVTHVNCGTSATFNAINKPNSPYSFPFRYNVFGSVGCGNMVTIYGNQSSNTIPISAIIQPRCGDDTLPAHAQASGFGASYAMTYVNLSTFVLDNPITYTSYTVSSTQIYGSDKGSEIGRCKSFVFLLSNAMKDPKLAIPHDINIDTKFVPATLQWNPHNCDLEAKLCRGPAAIALQLGCRETCGDVSISYPFGIKPGCFKDKWFRVTCNETQDGRGWIPFLSSLRLQILYTSFQSGTVRVNNSKTYFNCRYKRNNGISIDLTGSPFFFSNIYNRFGSAGCDNKVSISDNGTGHLYPIGGCMQPRCSDINATSNGGCLTTIPPGVSSLVANMTEIGPPSHIGNGSNFKSCGSAFMVDIDSMTNPIIFEDAQTHVSIALEWGTPTKALCKLNETSKEFCSADGEYCLTNLSSTHLCVCRNNSLGDFATDVCDEGKCGNPKYRYCYILCLNTPGNHCSLPCPDRYEYFLDENMCKPKVETIRPKKPRHWAIIIGCISGIGTVSLLLGTWHMYKVLKRRKEVNLKQKYFKRNGGLLMQQQLSANESNVERLRLFTSKELEKATDYYNQNRVLGQGGQGTVYKGMLTDGSIVAVKKSKIEEERKLDDKKLQQFVNEVIILSQINHRNVVKLLGCCLETKVPLLVYEFVPNGTLYELIHHQNEEFPLTWDMRFRVAIEIANALSYLHSAASTPIYHRDIKSRNILLDDKYRAKESDFGTSRSVTLDQTHLTTQVQGTFGYLDPEYFRSNQFTEKSDVYSFGVVLVELLTGQKPISSVPQHTAESEEVGSLIPFFLLSMRKGSLTNVLDPRVVKDAPQEEIIAIAKLAKRCLNLKGKRRPTMKQVAWELELIRASGNVTDTHQENDDEEGEEDSDRDDVIQPWDVASCSTRSPKINDSVTLSLLDTDDHTSSL